MSPYPTTAAPRTRSARAQVLPFLLLALCLLPFVPGLTGPFQLDDFANLQSAKAAGVGLREFYTALFNNPSGLLLRPLANATFMAQQAMGSTAPFDFKLVNLLLHGLNGVLVWHLARRLQGLLTIDHDVHGRMRHMPLLAAMLWTLHPLQVSSVLYVVQRMTLLSSTFILLALLAALRPLPVSGALASTASGVRHTVLVGLLATLALLSKETGALVPVMLLAILAALPPAMRARCSDTAGKRLFKRLGVWLPLGLGALATLVFWKTLIAGYAGRMFGLGERLISECWILIDYLITMIVPLPARMGLFLDDAAVVGVSTPGWFLAPVALALLFGVAFLFRRRWPYFAFAVFWFLACHLLESTFLPLELKFEHRNYLALLGPALLGARGLYAVRNLVSARVGTLAIALTVLLLGGLTTIRSLAWASEISFLASEAAHHPRSVRAQLEVADIERNIGREDLAYARMQGAMRDNPNHYVPMLFTMVLACKPGYVAPWARMEEHLRAHPNDVMIRNDLLYSTALGALQRDECAAGFKVGFARHVDAALRIYRSRGIDSGLVFFQVLKAELADDPRVQRDLVAAIPERAQSTALRLKVGYLDIKLGDPAAARKTLSKLKESIPEWHPDSALVRAFEQAVRQAFPGQVQAQEQPAAPRDVH